MSNDDKYTPLAWHWAITPEQIEKIKQNDRETINKVYFDNYNKLLHIAKKYCWQKGNYTFLQDCLQQIYVDFQYYDFTNTKKLFYCIKKSCCCASLIYWGNILSFDDVIGNKKKADSEKDTTFANFYGVNNIDIAIEQIEQAQRVLTLIEQQKHLTNNQKDVLTAIAFGVSVYGGIYEQEKRQAFAIKY